MVIDHIGTMKYLHKFLPNVYCIFISVIIYYTYIYETIFMYVCVYKQWLFIFSCTNIILSTMDAARIHAHTHIYTYTGEKNPVRLK